MPVTQTHGSSVSVGSATQNLSRLLGGVFECPEVHLLTVVKILPCSSDTMTRLICDDKSENDAILWCNPWSITSNSVSSDKFF
jgi:hypothetical protein